MLIGGLVKSSLIEYPGKIAAVVFTGQCNFRCPYCHNVELVLRPEDLPRIDHREVLRFLAQRQGLIDGVVLSGGEPTLPGNLESFLRQVKGLGLAVKLDTNGSNPQVLETLAAKGLIDYVAMDVKAPLDRRYDRAAGVAVDLARIEESIAFLLSDGLDYEFRTTVVPGIVASEDVEEIARLIAGATRYFLQQFSPRTTIDPRLSDVTPYAEHALLQMAEAARGWVKEVRVRGLP